GFSRKSRERVLGMLRRPDSGAVSMLLCPDPKGLLPELWDPVLRSARRSRAPVDGVPQPAEDCSGPGTPARAWSGLSRYPGERSPRSSPESPALGARWARPLRGAPARYAHGQGPRGRQPRVDVRAPGASRESAEVDDTWAPLRLDGPWR